MSAADNLLKRKGPVEVETAEIIKDGEHLKIDRRRALSYVSRGLAEWAVEGAETPLSADQDFTEALAQPEPASEPQVADSPADDEHDKYVRTLEDMTRDEVSELAKAEGLPYSGTKAVIIDRLSAAHQAGATAGDVPLSGADSDGD